MKFRFRSGQNEMVPSNMLINNKQTEKCKTDIETSMMEAKMTVKKFNIKSTQ